MPVLFSIALKEYDHWRCMCRPQSERRLLCSKRRAQPEKRTRLPPFSPSVTRCRASSSVARCIVLTWCVSLLRPCPRLPPSFTDLSALFHRPFRSFARSLLRADPHAHTPPMPRARCAVGLVCVRASRPCIADAGVDILPLTLSCLCVWWWLCISCLS
jgi:hypothetical protein